MNDKNKHKTTRQMNYHAPPKKSARLYFDFFPHIFFKAIFQKQLRHYKLSPHTLTHNQVQEKNGQITVLNFNFDD
jgi:hypothetical protein